MTDQLALADEGELAPTQTFKRTANRAKSIGIIRKAPWDSWKGSRVGKHIRFVESFCVAPTRHHLITLHAYQREMFEAWLDPSVRAAMEKIARGNAKTTTAGSLLVSNAFLEEDGDYPIVASTVKQAEKTTYGAVLAMTAGKNAHPELADRVQKFTSVADKRLEIPQTGSVIYPMADNEDALQGLNHKIAVLDEASVASPQTWDALRLAGGKRDDSLALGISTPSFELDGNAMLDTELAWRAGAHLPGFIFREHCAPKGCDHKDEANWYPANPALLTVPPILHIDALRADVGLTGEQSFRCYRLAQWPDQILEGWLGEDGPDLWAGLEDAYEFVRSEPVFAGVDVSLRHDSTAVVAIQERPDGRWHAKAMIWYPESGVVDQAHVREYLRQLSIDFKLRGVAYDPRFFEASAQDLDAEGLPMIEVPQTASRMVPAVGVAYRSIVSRLISHDGDPAFARQVVNAAARPSEGGMTLHKKPKSNLKCDAAIALCLAMSLAEFRERELTEEMLVVM